MLARRGLIRLRRQRGINVRCGSGEAGVRGSQQVPRSGPGSGHAEKWMLSENPGGKSAGSGSEDADKRCRGYRIPRVLAQRERAGAPGRDSDGRHDAGAVGEWSRGRGHESGPISGWRSREERRRGCKIPRVKCFTERAGAPSRDSIGDVTRAQEACGPGERA